MLYQLTLENMKTVSLAIKIAKEAGRKVVETQDYLLGGSQTPDTTLGRILGRSGIVLSDIKKELAYSDSMVDDSWTKVAGRGYRTIEKYEDEIRGPVKISPESQSAVPVSELLENTKEDLYLSKELAAAFAYGQERFFQNDSYEGIDTRWILEGITRQQSSNGYRLYYKLLILKKELYELDPEDVYNKARSGFFMGYAGDYTDGGTRRKRQEQKEKAEKVSGILADTHASLLDKLTVDITAKAAKGLVAPVVGRKQELEQLKLIISRTKKNNVLLLGPAGVGKTALVEGLAQRIATGEAGFLNNYKIREIMLTQLMLTKYDEQILQRLMDEMVTEGNTILFIDEFHVFAETHAIEFLKPALARSDFRLIGATTTAEWKNATKNNPALQRRFQAIELAEPTVEETTAIIKTAKKVYENNYGLNYSLNVQNSIAALAKKYYPTKMLPDSALTLLDNTGAYVANRTKSYQAAKQKWQSEIDDIKAQIKVAQSKLYNEEELARLDKELQEVVSKRQAQRLKGQTTYQVKAHLADLFAVIKLETGEEATLADVSSNAEKLQNLEKTLKQKVIGQDHVIEPLAKAVKRIKVGLNKANRPLGVYAFFGPTGVGKTETAKVLASEVFGGENHLITVDMSEYQENADVYKMLGANPGFVGYGTSENLLTRVARQPESVVLFDEIEKAHPAIFDLFLQLFDEGRLTASDGQVVDFSKTMIILTSNLGAKADIPVGFTGVRDEQKIINHRIDQAMKKKFRPEFLNRIDESFVFHALAEKEMLVICQKLLEEEKHFLEAELGIKVSYEDTVAATLVKRYYDPENGARPLKRAITKELEDNITDLLLNQELKRGNSLQIISYNQKLDFRVLENKSDDEQIRQEVRRAIFESVSRRWERRMKERGLINPDEDWPN